MSRKQTGDRRTAGGTTSASAGDVPAAEATATEATGTDGTVADGTVAAASPTDAIAARPRRPEPPDEGRGEGLVRSSWVATAVFTVLAIATTVAPDAVGLPFLIVCVVLFLVGLLTFMAAYAIAVGRSRTDAIGMGGLYFVAGSAPRRITRSLMGAFAVQTLVAVVSASAGLATVPAEQNNPLAFGFGVPLLGLGLAGLWAARFGTFPPRQPPAAGRGGGSRATG